MIDGVPRRLAFAATSSLLDPSPARRWLPIARHLARRGHDVTLLLLHPTYRQAPRGMQVIDGVRVSYVAPMHVAGLPGARRYYGPLGLLAVSLRAAMALAAGVAAVRPDAVHLAKAQPINGLAAVIARPFARQWYLDADDLEADANRFGGAWQQRVVAGWERHVGRLVRGISVNTSFLAEFYRQRGVPDARIITIPNGLEDAQFVVPAAEHVAAVRRAHDLHGPTVAYVGALSTVAHGVPLLLEGFAQVARRDPRARLVLVGDGDDRSVLQARAAELGVSGAVRWIGRVAGHEVAPYLAAADCSVDPVADTPAMRARSPLKIIESLAIGVPVVTSAVGDRRAMLADGSAGVLVAPDDATALAHGIERAVAGGPASRLAARAGAERYRWSLLLRQWPGLYRS